MDLDLGRIIINSARSILRIGINIHTQLPKDSKTTDMICRFSQVLIAKPAGLGLQKKEIARPNDCTEDIETKCSMTSPVFGKSYMYVSNSSTNAQV